MFPGPLSQSLAGKALDKGIWSLQTLDLRDFALDKHRTVDDSPYGGGTGMVMKPDVLARALDLISRGRPCGAVAAELGYASPAAFSAMFKRAFGVPPGRFMQERGSLPAGDPPND